MSRSDVRAVARELRRMTGTDTIPWFPVVETLELVLDQVVPGFNYDVRTEEEMGGNHALTDFNDKLIIIREDVYMGATDGKGRDRATLAHELGHAILHGPERRARAMEHTVIRSFEDPEWQAKAFAGELLMFHEFVGQCSGPHAAAEAFGVSLEAAEFQWKVFRKDGYI